MSESKTPEGPQPPRRNLSTTTRVIFFFTGVALPCCSAIVIRLRDTNWDRNWQRGSIGQYLLLIANHRGMLAFLPLLGYSIVSFSLMLDDFERWSRVFLVRLGVYGGMLLTAQSLAAGTVIFGRYDVKDLLASPFVLLVFMLSLPTALLWLITTEPRDSTDRERRGYFNAFLVMLLGLVAALETAAQFELSASVVFLVFASLIELVTYVAMSLRVLPRGQRLSQFSLLRLLGSIGWLSAYFAACRWAVHLAIEQYPVGH